MFACCAQDLDALPITSSSALLVDKCASHSLRRANFCIGAESDDVNLSMRCDILDAEEEEIWNSTELSLEEKRDLVDLLHIKSRQMGINAYLQRALYACEDSNADLELQNNALKDQIKSMKHSRLDAATVMGDMDIFRAALAEKQRETNGLMATIRKLEKEKKAMTEQIAVFNNEMSIILLKKEADKKKITDLSELMWTLEKQLDEMRIQLAETQEAIHQKDNMINCHKSSLMELNTTGEKLKTEIKDLESQLELARVAEGGSFLHLDGTFSLPQASPLSLAEEFSFIPGLQKMDALENAAQLTNEIADILQQEMTEGYEFTQTALNVEELKSDLAELKAMEEQAHNENSTSWFGEAWRNFKRGALVGAAVGLGVLLPLNLLSLATSSCFAISGLDYMDVLWSTTHHIALPFCAVQHFGMPPF